MDGGWKPADTVFWLFAGEADLARQSGDAGSEKHRASSVYFSGVDNDGVEGYLLLSQETVRKITRPRIREFYFPGNDAMSRHVSRLPSPSSF